MAAVNDVRVLDKAREDLLGNDDLMRLVGKSNPDMVDILRDPDMNMTMTNNFDEMEASIQRLANKYSGGGLEL